MDIKTIILKDKDRALMINDVNEDAILNRTAEALNKGVRMILFYNKALTDSQNLKIAKKLRQLCSLFGALFIILSRVDLALLSEADGICLFEYDISINDAKKIIHDDKLFGFYTYTDNNLSYAQDNNVDFILKEVNANFNTIIKEINLIR